MTFAVFVRFHPHHADEALKQRNSKYSTLPAKLPSSNGEVHNEIPHVVKPLNLDTMSETSKVSSAPATQASPGSLDSSVVVNSTSYQSDVVNLCDSRDVSPRISTVTESEETSNVNPSQQLPDQPREEKLLMALNKISGNDGVLQVKEKNVTMVTVTNGDTSPLRPATVVYNTTATFVTKTTSVASPTRSSVLTGVAVPPPYKNGPSLSGRPDPANYHFPEKETIEIVVRRHSFG